MKFFRSLLLLPALFFLYKGHCLEASIFIESPSFCGAATGRIQVSVFGGDPPYTYLWNTGATGHSITQVPAGNYSVTVTDADQTEVTVQAELESMTYSEWYDIPMGYIGPPQMQGWCAGGTPYAYPGGAFTDQQGNYFMGPGPWTFSVNGVTTPTVANACYTSWLDPEWYLPLDHPVGSTVSINYSDGNGCPGHATVTIKAPIPEVPLQIMSVSGSCNGIAQGSVMVAAGEWVEPLFDITYSLGLAIREAGGDFLSSECGTNGVQDINPHGSVRTFTGLPPGDYEMVVRPSEPSMPAQPEFSSCQFVPFTIPDLGADCGGVTGRAFMDYNLNCTRGSNEPYVPGGIIEILPGPYYATLSSQGEYVLALPSGSYTLEQQSEVLTEHCIGGPIPFTITAGQATTVHIADTSAVPLDVRLMLNSGIARPGFEFQYTINVRNLTPASSGTNTVTFTFDPTLTFISNSGNGVLSGNTITWVQSPLTAWHQRNYTVQFEVPPDVGLLGYELVATAEVTTANTDGNLDNNTATNYRTITGAYDPNDKLATTSSGGTEYYQLGTDEWIDYTIRFQNTGTDTAFNVVITDTLPSNLDPGSIIIGASSHSFSWELRDQGTLKFRFPNIQLPDSNVNEPLSHGYAGFRIKPRLPLTAGDEIVNIANIYDFNPPVITDPSILDVTAPTVNVAVKTFLAGPYDPNSGLMQDQLRAGGWLPLNEPYTGLGYSHVGGGGSESTSAGVLSVTGSEAIVDWVVIELRDATDPDQILQSRSALIRRDGQVVDVDGVSPVGFNAPVGNYHVAIRHRNHLGCMRATPIPLQFTPVSIDLTTNATDTWGTNARNNINGTMVLWPGDVNFDGQVKYVGADNDRDAILLHIGGNTPTNIVTGGYYKTDVNMDGASAYTGTANDRDILLLTIGGVVPTAVRVEQVP